MDAIRKRVQRGTIPHERDHDGRVWILLDTGRPRQDTVQDTDKPPSDSTALISAKDETIATLREQLEAERQAHAEARRLLLAALEKIPPAIEAPQEARESPVSEARPGPSDTPTPAPGEAQEGTEGAEEQGSSAGGERRPWWRRILGG